MREKPIVMKIGKKRQKDDRGRPLKLPEYEVTVPLGGVTMTYWLTMPTAEGARKVLEAGFPAHRTLRIIREGKPIAADLPISYWLDKSFLLERK